jgi:PAS domain S-box-containing protein
VDATHPLARKVTAIRAAGVAVQEIFLGPLGHEDLERLVAGALQCDGAWAQPLAQLVHEKTAGNPLFTNQFIQALADEGLIAFDRRDERWSWDLQPIRAKALTGNVVEMVLRKMGRLPAHTLRALEDLACLGNRAATGTLALAHGTSEEDLHADLWEALHRELVVRSPDGYRFVHDRVQEAAYRLIPEATRPQAHLRIGRALAAGLASEQRDESLFDIVGQLNRGASLLHAPEERLELVELDLGAARRAMSTAAHASARAYLEAAAALVGDEAWQRRPDLMFELELRRAECEFQTAEPARAIERLQALLPRAHNLAERAAATSQLVDIYLMVQRPDLGLGVGFACLAEAGFAVPGRPSAAEARSAYDRVLQRLGGRSIESLAQLPLSTDDGARGVLAVLAKMLSCAVVMDHALLCLLVSAGVELSLEHGNCDPSTFVYSYFGVVAAALYGDVEIGYRFGQLGRDLVAAGLRRFEGFVEGAFALHITPWSRPAGESRALVRECIVAAQRRADLIIFVTCGVAEFAIVLVNGDPLADVEAGCDRAVEQARRAGFPDFTQAATLQGALVRNLRGLTDRFGRLDDGHTSEAEIERYFAEQAHLPTIEAWYWIRKAQARYLAGEFQDAAEALDRALPLAWTCRITFEAAELAFYGALVHAAVWDGTPAEERPGHIEAVRAFHKQLETWARHCPANFANRATLAAAELARIESRDDDALQLYAEAARAARDSAFWHNEALVNELAARFHASRAREGQARELLRAARRAYQHWGADGKVRQLDEWQGASGEASSSADESRTVQTPVEQLDLAVVLQVLQAVSGETDLGRLISTVMRLALEQAGAARGLLILPRGNAHRVEAEAATYDTGVAVVLQPDDTTATALPQSVLQYVLRTNESVLLHEASGDLSFGDDAYLRTRPARSVLCMPLLKQARLVGVLYLENPLISHAFTPARLTLLKLLASEAAISLENARLYRDLQEREARVRRLVDANIIGIVLWHRDGRILEANDAFLRMVGYARTDVLSGRIRWADLSPPDWAHEDVRAMDTVRDVGEVQAFEREVLRKDGARVPVLVGAANFEGTPDEGVGFFVDLSENKRAEQAARESEMRLANANRVASIGHLAAAITHEINQPLAGIITNTSAGTRMLATDPADLPAIGETLRRTLRDAERASEVIRRLRSLFSSRDSVAEDVDLNEVAQSVAELMTADFRRERVSLALDLGQGLLPVLGDRVQLQQVVLNLLRNAAEATRDVEGRPREVLLRTARDGDDQVRLSVTDSGHGLDPSTRARLFEAFHTTKPDGMGIGLSVSHTIIERHQGTLRAEDNTGPGATFMFSLPTVPSDGQRAVE